MDTVSPAAENAPTETPAPVAGGFVGCYAAHYPRLVRALMLAGADTRLAEDVAQEAFARALARWSRVEKGANPAGYVYRTAFRLVFKKAKGDLPGPAEPSGSTAAFEGHSALRVTVEGLIAAMPPKRRSCAVLCLVLGFEVSEAADLLGIAPGTVRKHLEEAREGLRSVISI